MIRIQKNWLKRRILMPVILMMAATLILSAYSFNRFIIDGAYQEMLDDDDGLRLFWKLELEHHEQKLSAVSKALMENDAVAEALVQQDRGQFLAEVLPLLESLTADGESGIMTFLLPDRSVLLRAHLPEMVDSRGVLSW